MTNLIFLQAAPGGGMANIIMIVAMFAVFYFFMIRPQQKKKKELEKYRENLKSGDQVVTIGGIHGKITSVQDSTITIAVEGAKLRVEKSAVSMDASSILNAETAAQAS